MRIAYLFTESYPNYDIDFQVLNKLQPNELKNVDSLIRTGVWGLFVGQSGQTVDEIVQKLLIPLLYNSEGHITKINDQLLEALTTETIYTLQFVALGRSLALALHERLTKYVNSYLGCVQVLANVSSHHQVFDICDPRYQIKQGKVFVLYSSETETEWLADEIVDHWKGKYSDIKFMPFTNSVKKRDVGFRYSGLDVNDGSISDVAVGNAVQRLGDIWEVHAEQTLYGLQDAAPKAQEELFAALTILEKLDLTSADVAQVALNFRRTLEEITRQYCPGDKEDRGWVKQRWEAFNKKKQTTLGKYAAVIGDEAIGITESVNRLNSLYVMGHKGIHENWDAHVFRSIALRLILLIHDLMMLEQGRMIVKPETEFFLSIRDDE